MLWFVVVTVSINVSMGVRAMEKLTPKRYWQEIARLIKCNDYPNHLHRSFLLQNVGCYGYKILGFSKYPDAINDCGDDLVQYQIINGWDGLIAKAAYHAILRDCDYQILVMLHS